MEIRDKASGLVPFKSVRIGQAFVYSRSTYMKIGSVTTEREPCGYAGIRNAVDLSTGELAQINSDSMVERYSNASLGLGMPDAHTSEKGGQSNA